MLAKEDFSRAHSNEVFIGLRSPQEFLIRPDVLLASFSVLEPRLQLLVESLAICKKFEELLIIESLQLRLYFTLKLTSSYGQAMWTSSRLRAV